MKVTFTTPIAAIHGTLSKSSPFYYKVQYGKTILARKPQRTKKSIAASTSPAARSRQQRFADLCRMATEILSTTTLRAAYEQRFLQQKQYATLRGFIIHSLSQSSL